jgi:hypothetical protein
MLIYDFIRKVQDEHDAARKRAKELHGQGMHNTGFEAATRAAALHDVLLWAGFEDCDVVKREGA